MREIKTPADFNEVVSGDKPVLLDFYADWCGPCQALLPIVEELAQKHQDDFVIAKVNVDQNRELAGQFGVRSIPALFFIQDGEVKEQLLGLQPKQVLDRHIHMYLDKAA
ncbi:MAG: thioredoxin [Bacteroidia bacterium]|nr:thioredoxin [Bacteroidia bacterium]